MYFKEFPCKQFQNAIGQILLAPITARGGVPGACYYFSKGHALGWVKFLFQSSPKNWLAFDVFLLWKAGVIPKQAANLCTENSAQSALYSNSRT